MRCKADIKVLVREYITMDGDRIQRPTYVLLQCPTTTKSTSAQCWRDYGLCGYHAAKKHPELYPKAKGHKTGGRHGKNNNAIPLCEIAVKQ